MLRQPATSDHVISPRRTKEKHDKQRPQVSNEIISRFIEYVGTKMLSFPIQERAPAHAHDLAVTTHGH